MFTLDDKEKERIGRCFGDVLEFTSVMYNGEGWVLLGDEGDYVNVEVGQKDYYEDKQTNLNKSNEELNMTNVTNKTLVTVLMIDQDENLTDDLFLVAKFEDVVCYGDDTQAMLMDLVSEGKVKELLDVHNKRRSHVVDKVQQRRHGNKVYLEPIKIKDLDIQIK